MKNLIVASFVLLLCACTATTEPVTLSTSCLRSEPVTVVRNTATLRQYTVSYCTQDKQAASVNLVVYKAIYGQSDETADTDVLRFHDCAERRDMASCIEALPTGMTLD